MPEGWIACLTTPVTDAWFFGGHAVQRRDLWTYARFFTVHQAQPWCGRRDGELYNVRGIGSLRFAARQGRLDRACVEDIWRISGICGIRGYELVRDTMSTITEWSPLWEGGAISITHRLRHY